MYCTQCGKEICDLAAVCVHCGAKTAPPEHITEEKSGSGWWWLGFFVPLAGLLVWLTCQDNQPIKAKKAGIGAIIGTITAAVLVVLYYVIMFAFMIFCITIA